jgi:hypothetical protein
MRLQLNNNRRAKVNKMRQLIKQQTAQTKILNRKISHNKLHRKNRIKNKNKAPVAVKNNNNKKFIRKGFHGLNR